MIIIFGVITIGLFIWGVWIAMYPNTSVPTQSTRHGNDVYDYPDYPDSTSYNRIAQRQGFADAMTDAELIRVLRLHQKLIRDEKELTDLYYDGATDYKTALMKWHHRIEYWIADIERESWPVDSDEKYADYIAKKRIDDATKARENVRRWIAHPIYAFLWEELGKR